MRIAIFHNLGTGGALRSTREQLKRLHERHIFDCYALGCSADNGYSLQEWCKNTRVYNYALNARKYPRGLGPLGWLLDYTRMSALQKKIAAEIDAESYDLCITKTCQYFEIPAILNHLSLPSIYQSHSTAYPALDDSATRRISLNPLGRHLRRVLQSGKRQAIRTADMIIANSWFSREELFRSYMVDSYLSYVGVNTTDFYPIDSTGSRRHAVLGVGNLAPIKAHDFSIRSLATIPEAIRPELWIAHHTEVAGEKDRLIALAQKSGVKLQLMECVNTPGLCKLYNSVSATLFPSFFEPLGLVPLESMACETPVIGIAEGGIRETVINGVTGVLTTRDEEDFGLAISDLLSNPEELKAMGARGREHVIKNWDWDALIEGFERLIIKATQRKSKNTSETLGMKL